MSIKVIHLADIHYSRERKDLVISSLNQVEETAKKNAVDLIAIAGDLFDSATLNSANTGFPEFLDAIKGLADQAPLAIIYGTPSHDVDSSLDVFPKITAKHNITILEPGQAYFLIGNYICSEADANLFYGNIPKKTLILGVPEPRKKFLLANQTTGKDESEETIREAMHKLCFMLAAKRREYPNIPCVLLYHGDVFGSTLQNSQTIERGTGIGITSDDLADIGADFNCLGHIHLPQQIGNLPAFYAGSITKNFGETHKAGYNLVKVDVGSYEIQRIDWNIPQNLKIEAELNEKKMIKYFRGENFNPEDITGKKVWLEITCTKEDRSFIDADKELQTLLRLGAVEGSRVTLCDIPTETVRAAEITAVNTPTQKYEVWAQNSELEVKPSILEKIKTLETEILKGSARAAGEWELVSLKLRGAIGIKKGVQKDEICFNLKDYSNGLIALVGDNGRGKTTLIENCHPYPQLLTRKGKLQNHFCLRDSFREVIFEDRSLKGAGHFIKFLIQIDGLNKSGSCKYFIFDAVSARSVDTIDNWIPRPGVDGTKDPYEEELNNIFGPVELYLRTAFATQRPTKDLPDLTDATAGEKKTLFVELAGIEYLQHFSEAGSEKAKQEAAKTHDAEIKMKMMETAVAKKGEAEQELSTAQKAHGESKDALAIVVTQGTEAQKTKDAAQKAFTAEELRTQKEIDARKAVDQVTAEISALEADIKSYEETSKNKATYERTIAEYEKLQKLLDAEKEKKQRHTEANMEKQNAYLQQKSIHDEKEKALENRRNKIVEEKNNTERQIIEIRSCIKLYERDTAEINENCPTCNQRLPEAKLLELNAKRNQFISEISFKNKEIEILNARIETAEKSASAINNELADLGLEEPTPPSLANFNETELNTIIVKMDMANIGHARIQLEKANEAKTRLQEIQKQKNDKLALRAERSNLVMELCAGVDQTTFGRLQRELQEAITKHSELTEKYTETKAQIARLESTIEAAKRAIAEIEAQEKQLTLLKAKIEKSKNEENDWNLVSKAFGKDGIQALELDALAPGISDTANKILESAYDDRFKISIETTRLGGAGKKTKQIEDFMIKVIDSEDGEAVNLEDKSGGEAVWIKRAIYDAFSVIRKRNTNFVFLSCFQDEADGALDSKAKTAYCRMLEAAHSESKLRHTIIITHSDEVKAMIEQKIDMEALASKVAA